MTEPHIGVQSPKKIVVKPRKKLLYFTNLYTKQIYFQLNKSGVTLSPNCCDPLSLRKPRNAAHSLITSDTDVQSERQRNLFTVSPVFCINPGKVCDTACVTSAFPSLCFGMKSTRIISSKRSDALYTACTLSGNT